MIKNAFLINSLTSGGAEKIVVTLLNKLIEENIDIELICLENNNFYEVQKNLKVTYLSNVDGNHGGIKKLLLIPYFAYKLKKYVTDNNIDIVQSHLYRANYINVFSQLLGSKHKSQIVNHGIASRYKTKGILGKINLFLIKNLYSKADKIILISQAMKKDLNELHNFKNEQLVINNPYDINHILDLKKETVSDFYFTKDKRYLITMGRLISLKRYQDVIRSLSFLHNDIELVMLGDGNLKGELIDLAKSLHLENRVHFLGNILNPFKYLSKADIFILSSETEGFPNSLIEALACNLPVISTDCISGPREILAPATNIYRQLSDDIEIAEYGILYPVGKVEQLTKAINILLENDDLKNNFINKSLDRAKNFSIEKIIIDYKKVLEID
ncbi:MAG: glycosyltransferase [Sulfurovaceae bacterium]|nr:glycosyltransferase [Sulfurovaceae bacterium]